MFRKVIVVFVIFFSSILFVGTSRVFLYMVGRVAFVRAPHANSDL